MKPAYFFIFLAPLILLLASTAQAAEHMIGTACIGDANNADWDTIGQCTSNVFVRANPFLAATIAIGTTNVTTGNVLDVSGSILSRSNNAGSATAIDWSLGNEQYTTANCGAFTFTNMTDGGSYLLAVQGATSGTCSFSQAGLTFKLPSNHGATTASTHTLYSFVRLGSNVYVTWQPGY